MPKAYVSATFKDLETHRKVASTVLRRYGYEDVAMEYYVAEDKRSVDKCLADVEACDLYVGIFAWRYGYQPKVKNPKKLSITEMEYRHAVKLNKPRLLFVIEDNAQWNVSLMDLNRIRIAALHEAVREDRLGGTFSTPDTLEARLSAALETRSSTPARSTGFDLTAYLTFVRKRYGVLDLDALNDPKRDEAQLMQMSLQSVFVEQDVKEDPPPIELPKELWQLLAARSEIRPEDLPEGLTSEELSAYATKPSRPILEALAEPQSRCSVILGDPGSGKSTLLRYVLVALAEPAPPDRLASLAGRVPVLVDLRAYAAMRFKSKADTIFEYFDAIAKDGHPLNGAALEQCLELRHGAVVMFDGVDEIFDPGEQETIARQIASFAERYTNAQIIVTSRIIGYPRSILRKAGFRHFTLQDLREGQVTEFVSQWYQLTVANPDDVPSRVERIKQSFKASPSIRQLAGNPMLLTIMAIIGKHQELPRERWKLYDHATSVLVQHWDVKKHLSDGRPGEELMAEDDKKELLGRLAFAMQRGKGGLAGNYIHAKELQEEFETYLTERYGLSKADAVKNAREMISQFHKRNFILSFFGANLYGFVHRAFLEFFCASAIVQKFQTTRELPIEKLKADVFGAHWDEKAWHEVLRLVCGMIGEEFASELIDYLTSLNVKASGGRNLVLAVGCLSELRRIERATDAATRLMEETFRLFDEEGAVESWQTHKDIVEIASTVGERWPNRERLIALMSTFDGRVRFTLLARRLGTLVGSIGRGSETIRKAVLAHLLGELHPFSSAAPHALVAGWPTADTATHLIHAVKFIRNANIAEQSVWAAAELTKDKRIAGWMLKLARSTTSHAFVAQLVVARRMREDPRALPILKACVEYDIKGDPTSSFVNEIVQLFERFVDKPDIRALLEGVSQTDRKNSTTRDLAAAILARHPLPPGNAKQKRAPKKPMTKRRKRARK